MGIQGDPAKMKGYRREPASRRAESIWKRGWEVVAAGGGGSGSDRHENYYNHSEEKYPTNLAHTEPILVELGSIMHQFEYLKFEFAESRRGA